jgi:ribonuclease PH
VSIEVGLQRSPEGSVLYRSGGTSVLVAASVEEGVRDFLRGTGRGWVTAEYAMHPRCGPVRQPRDGRRPGGIDGRVQEIQRLVGRALRAAVVPEKLRERTVTIDCDVLDADGGTRTASITGGFVALALALEGLRKRGLVGPGVLRAQVVAVSVGLVDGVPLVDLCYEEDRDAQVDLNVVATAAGDIVEVQGTAEGDPITRAQHDALLTLALGAIPTLAEAQRQALRGCGVDLDALSGRLR